MNAQKHYASTVTSFKIPTLIEAEAAISPTCFLEAKFESKIAPKISNSETISKPGSSITSQGTRVQPYENENDHPPRLACIHQHIPLTAPIGNHGQIIIDTATYALSQERGILQNRVESSS